MKIIGNAFHDLHLDEQIFILYWFIIMISPKGNNSRGERESAVLAEQGSVQKE